MKGAIIMNKNIECLINQSVEEIILKSTNKLKLDKLVEAHSKKIHFIPSRYRVFGGLLQSMNIQFGNFIETLMKNLVKNESKYEILDTYCGKKSNIFRILKKNEEKIDLYITKCQVENVDIESEFPRLQQELYLDIIKNKLTNQVNSIFVKHDIDLLFKNKTTGIIYYVEIKYNDDHDTGKFVDINRKFIKTYAYLLNEFDIENFDKIVPILFFFNNKKLKGNIYIPENKNIKRGKQFFVDFLTVSYEEVDDYLSKLSEYSRTVKAFDDLYRKIMKIKI